MLDSHPDNGTFVVVDVNADAVIVVVVVPLLIITDPIIFCCGQ